MTSPRTFILRNRLAPDELDALLSRAPNVVRDVFDAEVVAGRVSRRERAMFELRRLGAAIYDDDADENGNEGESDGEGNNQGRSETRQHGRNDRGDRSEEGEPPEKKRKVVVMRNDGDGEDTREAAVSRTPSPPAPAPAPAPGSPAIPAPAPDPPSPGKASVAVEVVNLAWLTDSLNEGEPLPTDDYLVFRGRIGRKPPRETKPAVPILSRKTIPAKGRFASPRPCGNIRPGLPSRAAAAAAAAAAAPSLRSESRFTHPPRLPVDETTEDTDTPAPAPVPAFLTLPYACQRPTLDPCVNAAFVAELKRTRKVRTLLGDAPGVRAYSTGIAAVAACPFELAGPRDVMRLPGCARKIAELYAEWQQTGRVPEADRCEADAKLRVLELFYNIWGVGDATAREFYAKGWRDLDDVIDNHWSHLSRAQQIGIKFYDEINTPMGRAEVERIGATVLAHARAITPGFELVVVGGYRRGAAACQDVDVILSHRDRAATRHFVHVLVDRLVERGLVTHVLSCTATNSDRGQGAAAVGSGRGAGGRSRDTRAASATGFDTLDKALLVWQEQEGADGGGAGLHRRVDVVVTPWATAGCALLGWTGATTFERDLRRYCRKERGLRFDSSGVRRLPDGAWVDLEGEGAGHPGPAPDLDTAERWVFAGLWLEYRKPEERCTA